ncbi:MAG: hypothetical protein Q7V88_06410 [Actinomycetota bacterium]|nr:hypothetical protein [Actinomycetota bacterium]
MRTVRAMGLIPAALLSIAACSDDAASISASSTTTAAPGTQTTLLVVTTVASATTVHSATDDASANSAIEGPAQFDVVVGVDSGPDRIEHVQVGSEVTLNITNPNAADEFHVHVIELEQSVDAGVMATFNFVADLAGTIEVESHETGEVLIILEVG